MQNTSPRHPKITPYPTFWGKNAEHLTSPRVIEQLVEGKAEQPSLFQREVNSQQSQPNLLHQRVKSEDKSKSRSSENEVRGYKRGVDQLRSQESGWLRTEKASFQEDQEALLGFATKNSDSKLKEKTKGGKEKGQKLKISKEKVTEAPKYQIVYKSTHDSKSGQEGDKVNEGDKSADTLLHKSPSVAVPISPRGHQSFFDKEKIAKFKLLAKKEKEKEVKQKKKKDLFKQNNFPKLQYGFHPIQKKGGRTSRGRQKKIFGKSTTADYDTFLDSLQAPKIQTSLTRSTAAPRKSKRERKSNLDFLGIFDTRQYFYIPNRRSDEAKTKGKENTGVLAKLFSLLIGH